MPSLVALSAALLACTSSAVATQFSLEDTYDSTNFFDKFSFFDQPDPNGGFVSYQNKANAIAQGLVGITDNNEVYVGVDHHSVLRGSGGRNSVRLESTAQYQHGLIVARFTHLPSNKCGTWPAFWTLGDNWPMGGEIDLYEEWNNAVNNQPALHVGDSATLGECLLTSAGQSSPILTSNCDNSFQNPPEQYLNQGCTVAEYNGPWASPTGGTYAIEWTSDYIKLYSWAQGREPSNIDNNAIDTASWGTPSLYLKNDNCNIDNHFSSQTLVLDITFCGNPAGEEATWMLSCAAATQQQTCSGYVAAFPGDFAETFFQIQDIRYFKEGSTSTTTSQASTSTTASSSSTAASSSSTAASSSSTAASSSSSAASSSTNTIIGTGASPSATASTMPTFRWTNTSSPAAPTTTATTSAAVLPTTTETTSVQLTTSTVYTTTVHTVTKCPPWVVDCPAGGYVTTETMVLYTTICPVTATEKPAQPTITAVPSPVQLTTSTVYTTSVYTVTKCPPYIVNCPAGGYVTTDTIALYTTICPVTATEKPAQPTPTPGAGQDSGVPSVPASSQESALPAEPSSAPGSGSGSGSGPQESAPEGSPAPAVTSSFTAPPAVQPTQITVIQETATVVPQPIGPGYGSGNGTLPTASAAPVSQASGSPAPSGQAPPAQSSGSEAPGKVVSGSVKTGVSTIALLGALVSMLL